MFGQRAKASVFASRFFQKKELSLSLYPLNRPSSLSRAFEFKLGTTNLLFLSRLSLSLSFNLCNPPTETGNLKRMLELPPVRTCPDEQLKPTAACSVVYLAPRIYSISCPSKGRTNDINININISNSGSGNNNIPA